MSKLPHLLVIAFATAAPVFFQAMASGPLTWATVGQAAAAFVTTTIAVMLRSPIVDPGVAK